MAALVFLLPDGTVYIMRGKDSPWANTGIQVPDLPTVGSRIAYGAGMGNTWFEIEWANRFGQVGRFMLAKNGRLTFRMLPKLPANAFSYTFSPSGRYLFLERGDCTLWQDAGRGWQLLLENLRFRRSRFDTKEEPANVSAFFDRTEQYLCIVEKFGRLIEPGYDTMSVFVITRSGLKSVFNYVPKKFTSISVQIARNGWFISELLYSARGDLDKTFTYRLSLPSRHSEAHLTPYGEGIAIGPPVGDAIALWQSDNNLRIPTGRNQSVLQQYVSNDLPLPLYYWHGVGPIWGDFQNQVVVIGDQKSDLPKWASPKWGEYVGLFLVTAEV